MAEIPEIGSNSIRNPSEKTREVKTDYNVMSSVTTVTSPKKERRKPWPLNLILPQDVPDLLTYLSSRKDDIIQYVIWPKIRDAFLESLSSVLGASGTGKQNTQRTINRVSYESKYSQVGSATQRAVTDPSRTSPRYSIYENIGFESADEADEFMSLVEELFEDQRGYISVLQFYNIAGRRTSPEQNNYGWLSLSGMKRIYNRGIYYVDMPWPVPLDLN